MVVVRNVFRCKPGQAKALVKMFKEASSKAPFKSRVMTDIAAPFWTVVFETEAPSLAEWEKQFAEMDRSDMRKPMEGYMDLVNGGYRQIYKIE